MLCSSGDCSFGLLSILFLPGSLGEATWLQCTIRARATRSSLSKVVGFKTWIEPDGNVNNGDMNHSCRKTGTMIDGVVMHDATAGGGEPRDLQIAAPLNRAQSSSELIIAFRDELSELSELSKLNELALPTGIKGSRS